MTKSEFLNALRERLSELPEKEVELRLNFYSEMIDDRVEDGVLEPAAVWHLGDVDEIASEIIADIPLKKLVKNKIKRRRILKAWEITLLATGSPVWFPLLLAVIIVAFAVYISIWAVIISLWAVAVSLVASSVGFAVGGAVIAANGNVPAGVLAVAAGFIVAGLSIFALYGCKMATKGFLLVSKKTIIGIKNLFAKKEAE